MLAAALSRMTLDLAELAARAAIFAHPTTVAALRTVDPHGAWYPATRRRRPHETRGIWSGGARIDDNSFANRAIKLATGMNGAKGFITCHLWQGSCYDPRYHTAIPNLALLPAAIAGLSDHDARVMACLRFRAYELYGWHPAETGPPRRPDGYPSPIVWRAPRPAVTATAAVRRMMAKRPVDPVFAASGRSR